MNNINNEHEDKNMICELLLKTIQNTRDYNDLIELNYKIIGSDTEIVTAVFKNGTKVKVNVSLDSGMAMIRDILKQLD